MPQVLSQQISICTRTHDKNKYMNKLRVHFGDETRRYHFTYDISTLQITSFNCSHAELYKNDFKRIVVKYLMGMATFETVSAHIQQSSQNDIEQIMYCLAGRGLLKAINYRDDEISVVYMYEEPKHPNTHTKYLVVHNTTPYHQANSVYKVEDYKHATRTIRYGPRILKVVYKEGDDQVCSIFLCEKWESGESYKLYAFQQKHKNTEEILEDYVLFNVKREDTHYNEIYMMSGNTCKPRTCKYDTIG